MTIYKEPILRAAHKHSIFHREEILESIQCSCFYCFSVFLPSVCQTAICPICGVDSVLGEKSSFPITDDAFLREINQFWF
jgi:hypothetical protein